MQKSIFSKYFRICAGVVIATVVLLGTMFMMFASRYFSDEKQKLLDKNADIAARMVLLNYVTDTSNGTAYILKEDKESLKQVMQLFAQPNESVIFFTDAQGVTQICTEDAPCLHTTYQISGKVLDQAKNGEFFEMGRLSGIYKETYYTMAKPVVTTDGLLMGYIFISVSAQELHAFLMEMLRIFLLCAASVLLIAFIATYFATAKMIRPLREMSQAAVAFGKGDLSARVKVDSDDEIGQLAVSFNNMAQSLSTLESMRRSFVANVSHELRTPMTSIAGFIDGILDGTIAKERQTEYLRIVSEEVKRLSRLVRSMLSLSRIEAGELKISSTQFNIVETICQTVFSFEHSIEEKGLDIQGLDRDRVMVEADPDLIHQVVYNLTENAVKFVNQGGYLSFSFTVESGMTYVGIRNSGEGLAKEEIPKVFDRFYKTDRSRGVDKSGVGLGLYIVRSIINLHGGTIIVRSVPGEYTEFVFSVPTAKVKNPALVKGREKDYSSEKGEMKVDSAEPRS